MENNKGSKKFVFVSENDKNSKPEVVKTKIKSSKTLEYNIDKGFYFGFKQRVLIIILLIIVLFGLGSFLVINSYKLKKGEVVNYNETSDSSYEVCLLSNDTYTDSCLREGIVYNSSIVNKIPINFKYNVDFSEFIDYQLYYHVILYSKIFDKANKDKILYENKEILVEKTFINKSNSKIAVDTDAVVNYKKYYDFINEYKKKYTSDVTAELEVIFYLDEYDEERKIGSLVMPLGNDTFEVTQKKLSNLNKSVNIANDDMNREGDINLFFGGFLIIISLILDIILVRLVKATFTRRSKYELELKKILSEYDKYIVNTSLGYEYDNNKNIIKVESIKELVDAANVLSKPIIYNKINNVKSEFIVEEEDKIYRYVLKDRD